MRRAEVYMHGLKAGYLDELEFCKRYCFQYVPDYSSAPISLTLPVQLNPYDFTEFPPFFEGLLPEGLQLEGLLRIAKLDRHDLFGQLVKVGEDLVGAVTVKEVRCLDV